MSKALSSVEGWDFFAGLRKLEAGARSCMCENVAMKGGRYRFGPFEFDPESLELLRQGAPVHLQSQPGRVLAYLLQNGDRTVSREELSKAIWGDETFVDFERGLNFCISQLRSALNDDSARPSYIRTLPKRGINSLLPLSSPRMNQSSSTACHRRLISVNGPLWWLQRFLP